MPASRSPSGTITFAWDYVPPPTGINSSGTNAEEVGAGIAETLFTTADGPSFAEPWLAREWVVAPDLSGVTIRIQDGVTFHGGWGELIAEDVAWSINDASARTNPESFHSQGGDLAAEFLEWRATGRYTLYAPFAAYDLRWQANALNDGWQATGIFSKSVFDQMGTDFMEKNVIGTGAFRVREWTEGVDLIVDAVPDHWRKSPELDSIRYVEIAESTTRLAGLRTGELDIASPDLKDIPDLVSRGFGTVQRNASEMSIAFSGNLWEDRHAVTGEPLDRPGLDPTKPWIGDPANPASMENARAVRQALAMSYDRAALADVLTEGFGWPSGIGFFNPRMPEYQERWDVPFDPATAKALLSAAGYPNAFSMELYSRGGLETETAEAVAGYWKNELGLDVSVLSYTYREFRPTIVNREASTPWIGGACDDGRFPRPWDWPVGTTLTSITRLGFGCGMEIPFVAETWLKVSSEPDRDRRVAINNQLADYMHDQMLLPGTFTVPSFFVFNSSSVKEWNMRPGLGGGMRSPENIVPARR